MKDEPKFRIKETAWRQTLAPLSESLNPEKLKTFKWDAELIDADTIRRITQRAVEGAKQYGVQLNAFEVSMDLTLVHLNIKPLKLTQLLLSGADDFSHDVFGILRWLDRREGVLTNSFKPKFFKED